MESKADTKDFFRIVFSYKLVIIISMVVVMTIVFVIVQLNTPMYAAQVKLLHAARWTVELEQYEELYNRTTQEVEWIKSPYVIKRVIKALDLDKRPFDYEKSYASKLKGVLIDYSYRRFMTGINELSPEEQQRVLFDAAVTKLMNNVNTAASIENNLITIKVTDYNSAMAAKIANSISRSYIMFDIEKQINQIRLKYGDRYASIVQLQDAITVLGNTLDGNRIPDLEAIGPGSIKIISQAQGGSLISTTNSTLKLIIAFFVSAVFGIAIAFILDYLDQSFRTPQDIEGFLGIPLLGSIPKRGPKEDLIVDIDNSSNMGYAKAFRILSDEMSLLMQDKGLKSILISDFESSRETSAIAANIGICYSHKEAKVLIIDANLRHTFMTDFFNVPNTPGLADILEKNIKFEEAIQGIDTNLSFLPAGETRLNPVTLFTSSLMQDMINEAKDLYDIVIVDSPDIRKYSDYLVLSGLTDATIIIINEGKVSRHVAERLLRPLKDKNVFILGAILNDRTYVIPDIIYKMT